MQASVCFERAVESIFVRPTTARACRVRSCHDTVIPMFPCPVGHISQLPGVFSISPVASGSPGLFCCGLFQDFSSFPVRDGKAPCYR